MAEWYKRSVEDRVGGAPKEVAIAADVGLVVFYVTGQRSVLLLNADEAREIAQALIDQAEVAEQQVQHKERPPF